MNSLLLLLVACTVLQAQAPAARPPRKEVPAASPKAPAAGEALVGNRDSKVFHRSGCKAAAQLKGDRKVALPSKAEAQKQGYKPCRLCKP